MERCAERIAEGKMQSTAPLTRSMFETDPDLRTIRKDPRYPVLTDRAFGDDEKKDGDDEPTAERRR